MAPGLARLPRLSSVASSDRVSPMSWEPPAVNPDAATVQIQLLHVADCPLVGQLRSTLRAALLKVAVPVAIEEIEGPCPSPTLLIAGSDVTGRAPEPGTYCRFDLPTEDQILAALTR